jgi:anti-sigma factor RsiW
MNGDSHDMMLGAYSMGVLDPDEVRHVEAHLSGCAACRDELAEFEKTRELLGLVPPEAFLDGPPPDEADHVLERALSDVRAEDSRGRRKVVMAVAAAVVVGVTGLGAGLLIGHGDGSTVSATALPSGARTVNTIDAATGAKLAATLVPADGWVRVRVRLWGVTAGTDCRVLVLAKDGTEYQAGSWRTSGDTPEVDGSALIAPQQVAAVEVRTLSGQRLVTARF